jgi:HAD superfamily hydrolase (TIGR01549 family)
MSLKFEGILLDIDNTLYSYKEVNQFAMNEVYNYLQNDLGLKRELLEKEFQKARNRVHLVLNNTGSSHNRLLYFQLLCESLGLDVLNHSLKLYDIYWDSYLQRMELFDGALEFIEEFSSKICFVTDLTAHIQHRKLIKLGLSNLGCKLVTSEEVGVEKPHPYIFKVALDKLKVDPLNACMIGDSYEKDFEGAILSGITPILKMNDLKSESLVLTFTSFKELREIVC